MQTRYLFSMLLPIAFTSVLVIDGGILPYKILALTRHLKKSTLLFRNNRYVSTVVILHVTKRSWENNTH